MRMGDVIEGQSWDPDMVADEENNYNDCKGL